jgi:hypothetical protein
MFLKEYRRKPHKTKAVRYDGTWEMAVDLAGEFENLYYTGWELCFDGNYIEEEVREGDWIFIDGNKAIDVKNDDFFYEYYEEEE